MQWKKDVIEPFETAIYMDADGKPITEDAFMQTLSDTYRAYKITTTIVDGHKKKIVLKLEPESASAKPGCA